MSSNPKDFAKIVPPGDPDLEKSYFEWLNRSAQEISMDGAIALIAIGVNARRTTLIVRDEAEKGLIQRALLEALDILESPRQGRAH